MQRVRGVKHNFQQYFSNVVAVSFIGGGTHRHLFLVKKNIPRYPIIVSRSQVLVDRTLSGISKWAGTRYFYPPEIVYSTGRNY